MLSKGKTKLLQVDVKFDTFPLQIHTKPSVLAHALIKAF